VNIDLFLKLFNEILCTLGGFTELHEMGSNVFRVNRNLYGGGRELYRRTVQEGSVRNWESREASQESKHSARCVILSFHYVVNSHSLL
jgi:hypothetical protein